MCHRQTHSPAVVPQDQMVLSPHPWTCLPHTHLCQNDSVLEQLEVKAGGGRQHGSACCLKLQAPLESLGNIRSGMEGIPPLCPSKEC